MASHSFSRLLDRLLAMHGRQFGDLTTLEVVDAGGKANVKYLCRCKCGNTHPAFISNLLGGRTKRCPRCHVHSTATHNLSHTRFYERCNALAQRGRMAADFETFENIMAWVKRVAPDIDLASNPRLYLRRFDEKQPYSANNSYLVLKDENDNILKEYAATPATNTTAA